MASLHRSLDNLDKTLAQTESMTANLDSLLAKMNRGEGTLGKLATDESLYNSIDSVSINMSRLLEDFRKNPKKYLKDIKKEAAVRLFKQADQQGRCMTNAEVAVRLKISPTTVSKYLQQWEFEHDELVPGRGTIHDLGPTLTHKKPIIRKLFLEGKNVEQLSRETRHSAEAIHRYICNFKQVLLCQQKKLTENETAFAVKISGRLVREYYALIEEFREQNPVLNEVLKYTNEKL